MISALFCEIEERCKMTCAKVFFSWFIRNSVFVWHILHLIYYWNAENVLGSGSFEIPLRWRVIFWGDKEIRSLVWENHYFADLFG